MLAGLFTAQMVSDGTAPREVECCCEPGRPAYNYAGAAQPHTVTPEVGRGAVHCLPANHFRHA